MEEWGKKLNEGTQLWESLIETCVKELARLIYLYYSAPTESRPVNNNSTKAIICILKLSEAAFTLSQKVLQSINVAK